jgi:hypothetical protein
MKSKGGAVMSKHKEISQPLQPSKINSNNSKISRKGKNPTRHRNATKSKAFVNSITCQQSCMSLCMVNDDIPEVKFNSSYLLLVFAANCVLIDFRWAFQCAVSPMWYKMRMNMFFLSQQLTRIIHIS